MADDGGRQQTTASDILTRRTSEHYHYRKYISQYQEKTANKAKTEREVRTIKTDIDEKSLNLTDRLGLAYCRLNCREWDEFLGPKPDGWDEMPDFDCDRKIHPTKHDIVWPRMQAIEEMIGKANVSRCWCMFELGDTEQEWAQWWIDNYVEKLSEKPGDQVDYKHDSGLEFRKFALPPILFFLLELLLLKVFML